MSTPNETDEMQWLEARLELRGAALDRWPAGEREHARALCERSAEARALLARAERVDAALDAWAAPEPSAALRRAVAEIPLRHPRLEPSLGGLPEWFPFRSLVPAVFTAALALALGIWAGVSVPEADDAVQTAQVDVHDGWSELTALAFADDLDQELSP